MRLMLAAVLLTLCSGCVKERIAVPLRPDLEHPERLVCEAASRPSIPTEYVIDWTKVTTVREARLEHDAYVRSVRTREGQVAAYIVEVEGKLFACSSNLKWWADYFAGL